MQAQTSPVKLRIDHGRRLQGWGGIFGKVLGAGKEEGHTLKVPKSGSGDSVASYFAMRKSSMGHTVDGGLRPLLNNKFVFQTGMLDQVSLLHELLTYHSNMSQEAIHTCKIPFSKTHD